MPLNRKLLRKRYSSRWGDREKEVNCVHLYPPCEEVNRPHCNMGGGTRGDCYIYLGKGTSCKLHKPIIKKLTCNEKLAKTTERERQSRLVEIGICPNCNDLINGKICHKCNLSWIYV